MALVRVFVNSDGTVRVLYPNRRLRNPDEPEAAFLERIATRALAHDSSLVGLPFEDVDDAALPSRATRSAWTLVGKTVAVK